MPHPRNHETIDETIKFLHEDENLDVIGDRIEKEMIERMPEGCLVLPPMTILDEPEPIKKRRHG